MAFIGFLGHCGASQQGSLSKAFRVQCWVWPSVCRELLGLPSAFHVLEYASLEFVVNTGCPFTDRCSYPHDASRSYDLGQLRREHEPARPVPQSTRLRVMEGYHESCRDTVSMWSSPLWFSSSSYHHSYPQHNHEHLHSHRVTADQGHDPNQRHLSQHSMTIMMMILLIRAIMMTMMAERMVAPPTASKRSAPSSCYTTVMSTITLRRSCYPDLSPFSLSLP